MGDTTIDHVRDLFRAVASIYSACFDDGGADAILFARENDEEVQKFLKCKSLAKSEVMSDHMKALWADLWEE